MVFFCFCVVAGGASGLVEIDQALERFGEADFGGGGDLGFSSFDSFIAGQQERFGFVVFFLT